MTRPLIGVGLWGMQATRWYPQAHRQLYREMIEEIQLAEEVGFDLALFTEHHFAEDGSCPSILLTTAAAGRNTSKIGIGTGLLLLPLHDKNKIKEQVDTLDSLLGDRLILGIGLGYRDIEFAGRSQSRKKRVRLLEDHVEFLRSGRQRSDGRMLEFWLGGHIETTARRAGRLGCGLMLPSTIGLEELSSIFETHRESLTGDKNSVWGLPSSTLRSVWVAPTDEEAANYMTPRLQYLWREQYGAWGMFDDIKKSGEAEGRGDLVSEAGRFAIVGNPDRVAGELLRVFAAGAECVICRIQTGTQSHDEIVACLNLLGREVLPRVREGLACA